MSKKYGKDRQVSAKFDPPLRKIKASANPDATEAQTIAWQFHKIDFDHRLWGFDNLKAAGVLELIRGSLKSFETMTWAELRAQSGGRGAGKGTNHHQCATDGFCKTAKDRLVELKLDDVDEIFSLRLTNTVRLYGIKEGRVLRFVWHDPHHGTNDGAYPTQK